MQGTHHDAPPLVAWGTATTQFPVPSSSTTSLPHQLQPVNCKSIMKPTNQLLAATYATPNSPRDEEEDETSSVRTLSPPSNVLHLNPPSKCTLPPAQHQHSISPHLFPMSPVSSTNHTSSNSTCSPSNSPSKSHTSTSTTPQLNTLTSPPSHPLLDCRYELGRKLGRGCFATVYKATRRSDGAAMAIKAIEKNVLDEETATLLDNELEILRAVSQHPGIVTLRDNVDTDTHKFFVMDFVDGGPLLDRIVTRGSFSENDARILLRTILLTLQFLSKLGCVHRDIKPENILVDSHSHTWPVKLTDFGLSAKMQPDELLYEALGTPLFVAPEILSGQGYDCSCDMWSLGVVIYIVLCGYPPFPFSETPAKLIDAIVNGRYDFPSKEWDHVSNDAKDMVKRMLEVDATKRITPAEALSHRWVARTQSTSALPNRKLKGFNARRKLKATVVVVRTMNMFRLPDISRSTSRREQHHEDLSRDVEHSRALIARMGIGLDGKSIPSLIDRDGQSFDGEFAMSRRRSLVLPVNVLEGDPTASNAKSTSDDFWEDSIFGSQVIEVDANTNASQYMESRAKAMVAEVNQSGLLNNETNPFMITAMAQRHADERRNGHTDGGQGTLSNSRPVALASLNFGLLDI